MLAPLPTDSLEAENARLRERVAYLEEEVRSTRAFYLAKMRRDFEGLRADRAVLLAGMAALDEALLVQVYERETLRAPLAEFGAG
jgi:hypothetical protein